jgi:hypothetical protein
MRKASFFVYATHNFCISRTESVRHPQLLYLPHRRCTPPTTSIAPAQSWYAAHSFCIPRTAPVHSLQVFLQTGGSQWPPFYYRLLNHSIENTPDRCASKANLKVAIPPFAHLPRVVPHPAHPRRASQGRARIRSIPASSSSMPSPGPWGTATHPSSSSTNGSAK